MSQQAAALPQSSLVEFVPSAFSTWAFLEAEPARIGVSYQNDPQPHLVFYPPVRVDDEAVGRFLDGCVSASRRLDDARWLSFSVDPDDGEVTLRFNLVGEAASEIDRALTEARELFDAHYGDLLEICAAPDLAEDDDDDFLSWLDD